MKRFKEQQLGDVLEFYDHQRIPLSSLERDNRKGEFRYYGAQGVIDHIDKFIFDGQFILIAEDGANLVTRNQPIAFLVDGQFWVNNHAHVVQGKPGVADDFFLTALLNNLNIAGFVTGAAQPKLSQQNLRQIKVSLPDFRTQMAITNVVAAYDDLMENNRRRMALLEESARLLYREWFVHLRFPGHEKAKLTNGVPKGWKAGTLRDICTDIRESVSPEELEPETPYIGLEHIPRRSISLVEWGRADAVTSSKSRFQAGDILFGKIRPYFHKVSIAFTDGVASSDAIVIRPHEENYRALVLMIASSDAFVAEASQSAREGSKMPRADWKLMLKYPVLIPSSGILRDFSGIVESITAQLKTLCFQTHKLRTARDLLLPRLMSGDFIV